MGSIQGIVTDASNNEPIQGVNISLSPTGLSAVTGSDGRYEFTNLEGGQYTVQGVKAGYVSNTKNITIVAGNVSSGDMTLTPEVSDFKLNVEYLDFGASFNQLTFKIANISTSLPISWLITESYGWLEVTPSSGNINAGQEVSVLVDIDRTKIDQSTTGNLIVEACDKSIVLPVNVTVSGANGPSLQLSETSLDFGTSATSLSFYVLNTGPANTSLNWTCSNVNVDWLTLSPTSGNTAGGSNTAVMATIDRDKIDGVVSTSVTVSGAGSTATITFSAAKEGAGAPILQLSEGSLSFGDSETTLSFLVKNVGSTGTTLDWIIMEPDVDWLTLTPMTGHTNAGSGTQVTAAVDRTKFTGTVTTTVRVNSQNNYVDLSVSASNKKPSLEVSTEIINFGGVSISETFKIKNSGDEGTTLQWNISTPTVDWLAVSPSSGNLNAGSSKTVTLTIDRTKFTGSVSTSLQITGSGQSASVLVAASTSQATLAVSQTSIDFGKVSTTKTFNVKNEGEEGSVLYWNIANPTVDWLAVTPSSGNLNANSAQSITLTIDRTKFTGDVSTTLQITGGEQSATVSITASTAQFELQVTPEAVDFGTISTTKTFTVKNNGEAGSNMAWSLGDIGVDWLTATPMSGGLGANQTATVTLTLDRTKFTGDVSTSLQITAGTQSATVTVSASTPVPAMTVSPTAVDFGTVSTTKQITISNTGESGSVLNWTIAQPSVSWLTVSATSGSTNANNSTTVTLTIDRNAFVGVQNTSITITGAGNTVNIPITVDNTVLAVNGLIAYYTFDDGQVTDWGGNYNGTNAGAITSSDTPNNQGYSMEFNGTSSYLHIPNPIFQTGTTWSYNMWFKTGHNNIAFFGTNTSYDYMAFNSNSKLFIAPYNYNSMVTWTSSVIFSSYLNNQWHMLTISWNGSILSVYVDASLVETANLNNFYWEPAYNQTTYFGVKKNGGSFLYYFNGKMDNIRTYNRALTQAEITILYNSIQ